SKKGEISFEQMLFARSLETMSLCADIAKDKTNAAEYKKLAAQTMDYQLLRQKNFDVKDFLNLIK
ncbi:MAG: hypothetical protein V4676_12120, partial [Bacteroidota bacterium]